MDQHPAPVVLDPAARDADAEHRLLRAEGPATRIDILGVPAWSVTDPALLKNLLTSPDVSKDARRHWPGFEDAVQTWPLALWVAATNMFTAYGGDHRRLRGTVAPAFSARRVAALRPTVEGIVDGLLAGLEAVPRATSPICGSGSRIRCPSRSSDTCWACRTAGPTSSALSSTTSSTPP